MICIFAEPLVDFKRQKTPTNQPQETGKSGAMKAANEIEQLRAGWVSVEDRLPPEGVRVIAYAPPYGAGSAHIEADTGNWNLHFSLQQTAPAHWMPLPEPPTNTDKG